MKLKRSMLVLMSLILFSGCSSSYYLCETTNQILVSGKDTIITIPKGKFVFVKNNDKNYFSYGNTRAYAQSKSWTKKVKIKSSELQFLNFDNSDLTYVFIGKKYGIENIPTYNNSSSTYYEGSGGTVHVKGYHRKDGTYVRPYTRSAPRSGGIRRK
ncbi:hypothetical protein Barb6_03132 [Bacteroidales bacterium Barb6]|nr:hypothetical protein Barb6_03132 [Bacteroidales bacterium Barb6]